MRQTARIENWQKYSFGSTGSVLYGNVYGHPKFIDGASIRTSLLEEFDETAGVAKTLNTDYELGEKYGPVDV